MIRLGWLNDTIMSKIKEKHKKIISIIIEKGSMQSSDIYAEMLKLGESISLVTVKRALSEMTDAGVLTAIGSGRSRRYDISVLGRIFAEVDPKKYCAIEPDKRYGMAGYNFNLFSMLPPDIFTEEELRILNDETDKYRRRINDLSSTIQKKELERLIIELSWKSSKIEGNTYTLLDTEKLILENKEASGHDKKEARMILNHKDAFNFIHENRAQFKTLTPKNLEELHTILIKDLSVELGLRKKPVGITGSKYRPLDNIYQITEATEALCSAVSKIETPYAKALIALLGIGYIQPFEDGNKRTGRLMANGLLLAYDCTPLSYRSIGENDYREAMLIFYELNAIGPFQKIFIDQYKFAVSNYTVK